MGMLLVGKAVMVTGGGSGIGRAAALVFAREGARVAIADVDVAGGQDAAAQVRAGGSDAVFVATDVSDAAQVEAAVALTVTRFGRLDGAFNNAGLPQAFTPLLDETEAMFERVMAVNVRGVWQCMRAQIRQMKAQGGGGSIVNTASVAGLRGAGKMAIYSASKHAVIGLTKSAALEHARSGPRINAVCPGAIETPMLRGIVGDNERIEKGYLAVQPIGRFGRPEEIAEAVAWLLSDAASMVTGVAMPVDGGMTS